MEKWNEHKKVCEDTDKKSHKSLKIICSPPKPKKESISLIDNRKNKIGYKLYQPTFTYKFDF